MAIAIPSVIGLGKPSGLAKRFGLGEQEEMALIIGAIDDNRPQTLGSPFQGVKNLRTPSYSPSFPDRLSEKGFSLTILVVMQAPAKSGWQKSRLRLQPAS